MFLEFGFHAQQTRLNGYFILSAYVGLYVSETKHEWLEQSAVWL